MTISVETRNLRTIEFGACIVLDTMGLCRSSFRALTFKAAANALDTKAPLSEAHREETQCDCMVVPVATNVFFHPVSLNSRIHPEVRVKQNCSSGLAAVSGMTISQTKTLC